MTTCLKTKFVKSATTTNPDLDDKFGWMKFLAPVAESVLVDLPLLDLVVELPLQIHDGGPQLRDPAPID